MKRAKNLFEKLITDYNIDYAITRSAKSKRKREDVQKVLDNRVKYIRKVKEAICKNDFTKALHKGIKIYDGSSKKERIIIVPQYIYEQIIHHAVIQVLQPLLLRGMYVFSCGSVPDRGIHYGKRYLEKYIYEHKDKTDIKYCLKFDIRHFYQSVDTDLLMKKFERIIKDKKMLAVIDTILKANIAEYDGEIINMGLPIGYYTSQWFANFFLQDFDHFVKEKLHVKCYVRYVDDIVIFGSNKKELHNIFYAIREFLKAEHLEIKDNWQIFKFHYINKKGQEIGRFLDFMGFRFYRNKTAIRKSIMMKATRKARKIAKKQKATWYDAAQLISYLGWFSHSDCHGVYQKHIRAFVNVKTCKKIISANSKKRSKAT